MSFIIDEKGQEEDGITDNMCHQCLTNVKERFVCCNNCVPCITTWYPKMFAAACPNLKGEILNENKAVYSKLILQKLVPFLEKQIEAGIQGRSFMVQQTKSPDDESEHVFWGDSIDDYLYCPRAMDIQHDDLKLFQWHWFKGEPNIVIDVLKTTKGLSREPLVMWQACSKEEVKLREFLTGYGEGRFDKYGWPKIHKLKDWPSSSLFEDLTHPHEGFLNLASKLLMKALNPNLGPKTYIGYGITEELGLENSVTKLPCDMSDAAKKMALH